MNVVCLDLEGVLVPEIWIAFAEATGIEELKRTTRDEPDYDKLMAFRLAILDEHGWACPKSRTSSRPSTRCPAPANSSTRCASEPRSSSSATRSSSSRVRSCASSAGRRCSATSLNPTRTAASPAGACAATSRSSPPSARCRAAALTPSRRRQPQRPWHDPRRQSRFLFRSTDAIKEANPDIPAFEDYDELLKAITEVL